MKGSVNSGHFNNNSNNKITESVPQPFVQTWCSLSAAYSNGIMYFLLRAGDPISVPFDGLGLVLAAYQTLSALQRGKWGKKNTQKVVAEDVLAVKYFSCRRIVSRTTRLMELQSECVFSFLFNWLISEVGKLCSVCELCCISYFQSALDCPCGSSQLFRRYLACKKSFLLCEVFKVTWWFLKLQSLNY